MSNQLTHYIGGKRVAGTSGRTAAVFNPATGAQSGTVDLASKSEVRAAVESAAAVRAEWANTTPLRRARILNKFLARCCPTRWAKSPAGSRLLSSLPAHRSF